MEYLVFGLILLAVPLVLPLGLWVALYRTRTRLMRLEQTVIEQRDALDRLTAEIAQLRTSPVAPAASRGAAVETLRTVPPIAAPSPAVGPPRPAPPAVVPPPPPAAPPVMPSAARPAPVVRGPLPPPAAGPVRPTVPPPVPPAPRPHDAPARPPSPPFDLESLVGVKLFSALAGIALVIAAVSFLRYSIVHGWLQPPVRVLIGLAVAIGLLVVCERKAARNYPATANALDAAAIAILFATFFAAHALWSLIPAAVAFALLAAVTALAVLLSIRRESLFIAVLGLLGGFATPALLSSGENRPIPLFAYLVLLNIGLAWVAYRQVWPVLTVLTLALTTIYQWGWVYRFLSASDLPVALGVFAVFPVLSVSALLFGRRWAGSSGFGEDTFERTAIVSAALPLVFIAYLAAVPAYGEHPLMLFGFLLLVDAGLFAVALTLDRAPLHGVAGVATVVVWAVWLASSYRPGDWAIAVSFVTAFALLYLFAPAVAARLGKPLAEPGIRATYAAPFLLAVFPILARIEPAAAPAWRLFAPLLVLVVLTGWRASRLDRGGLFFLASFFAVTAEAVWSATHLTSASLPSAVVVYALFGVALTAIPVMARRAGKPLRPDAGGGVVLIASLAVLLFLSAGSIAPVALWALALLLAILNAGLFIESASSRLPALSQAGSTISWFVLGAWWLEAAGAVGVLPSLAVVTVLTLVTLAGHAWTHAKLGDRDPAGVGVYLGLIGHAFLWFIAVNPGWSLPPWPLFGCLAVLTLATTATAMVARTPALHVLGVAAACAVIAAWTAATAWAVTGIAASAVATACALAWMALRPAAGTADDPFRRGAAVALMGGEAVAILAAGMPMLGGEPSSAPFALLLAFHAVNLIVLLALVASAGWKGMASLALALGWIAVLGWQAGHDLAVEWRQCLALAGVVYLIFCGYAVLAGQRRPEHREPWLVALGATAMAFFAGRQAFDAAGLESVIGLVPVLLGLTTVGLLRSLLRLEQAGRRDITRLALVAGSALALATVAIPLQLEHQWVTIGWALEGAALAWLFRRVPHRGLLVAATALLAVVFVRLSLNPSIWTYELRGSLRILNWYLYAYLIAAAAMGLAAWWLSTTTDRLIPGLPRVSRLLPPAAVILLFLLLNIEIADFYATGPEITFRFGATVSQDLTYTIGWLTFGMLMLAAGIYAHNRPSRMAAVALIAVTAFKCFLYDLASLGGLYRVGSFVGLAVALALVSLALQKFVLARPEPSR